MGVRQLEAAQRVGAVTRGLPVHRSEHGDPAQRGDVVHPAEQLGRGRGIPEDRERVVNEGLRYRFVIDMASLRGDATA